MGIWIVTRSPGAHVRPTTAHVPGRQANFCSSPLISTVAPFDHRGTRNLRSKAVSAAQRIVSVVVSVSGKFVSCSTLISWPA